MFKQQITLQFNFDYIYLNKLQCNLLNVRKNK